jgi:SAM-dependent methyltransferase
MHEKVKKENMQTLVQNPALLAFSKKVLTESYVECVPGFENEMRALMLEAFERLEASKNNEDEFNAAVKYLVKDLFRKGEPGFWFNQAYKNYKQNFKPTRRYANLKPWLIGNKVLDIGCGDGLTSAELHKHGYQISLTDVLDYRAEQARHLPFVQMDNPQTLPYRGERFDTGILLAVLHHMEDRDLLPILSELRASCRRLIIEEDTYLVPGNVTPPLEQVLQKDHYLRAFTALPAQDQLRYLMFVDTFANAITQGIGEMGLPFNFRSVGEWQELFEQQGFHLVCTHLLGFQEGFFNRSCHTWFILDTLEG